LLLAETPATTATWILPSSWTRRRGVGLFALGALERRLAELVGRRVDLLPEPVEKPRLVAHIDRDRRRAF
jgi:predicted nucleotidyltransferase